MIVYKMQGYADESEDDAHFAMAAVFSPMHHWGPFEDAWTALVGEYPGLDEFHTEHCVGRKGYWKGWDYPERDAVLQRFVSLLVDSPFPSPVGFTTALSLESVSQSPRE